MISDLYLKDKFITEKTLMQKYTFKNFIYLLRYGLNSLLSFVLKEFEEDNTFLNLRYIIYILFFNNLYKDGIKQLYHLDNYLYFIDYLLYK